jgi:hypothetical protein
VHLVGFIVRISIDNWHYSYSLCSLGLMTLASFWMSGCNVIIDKQRSPLYTVWRGLHTLTANKCPTWSQIPPDTRQKICKIQLCLLCCGVCRGEGNIWFNCKFEIFRQWNFSGSPKNYGFCSEEIEVWHVQSNFAPFCWILKFWTNFIHSMKDYECCGWKQ